MGRCFSADHLPARQSCLQSCGAICDLRLQGESVYGVRLARVSSRCSFDASGHCCTGSLFDMREQDNSLNRCGSTLLAVCIMLCPHKSDAD